MAFPRSRPGDRQRAGFHRVGAVERGFAWQHTAARQPDGTLTLFDNQAAPLIGDHARGLRLDLDTKAMTAEVVTEYEPRQPERLSSSMDSFEELENGNIFIGWGSQPYYSEHTATGELVYEAWLGGPDETSAEEFITVDRAGFETALPAPADADADADADHIIVEALDEGRVLGAAVPD